MKIVRNKTGRPLRVPLPGRKTLHLGPAQTAEVSDRALEHARLQKLVEDGSIEIVGEGERGAVAARPTRTASRNRSGADREIAEARRRLVCSGAIG
jgi:hypothetical protein